MSSTPLEEQGRKARLLCLHQKNTFPNLKHLCYHFSDEKDREEKEQTELKSEVMN